MSEGAGRSTVSPSSADLAAPQDARPSLQEEQKQYENVIVISGDGGASKPSSVRVRQPAPVYRQSNSTEYTPAESLIDEIDSFHVPSGVQLEGAPDDSTIDGTNVDLVKVEMTLDPLVNDVLPFAAYIGLDG